MSKGNLMKEIAANPFKVTEIVGQRPTVVGELIQQSLDSGQAHVAHSLIGALRAAYTSGSSDLRSHLFRSVMRAEGPTAQSVRDVMRTLVEQEGLQLVKAPNIPGVPKSTIVDPRTAALDAADKDPVTAKFRANFIDRPDEAAAQLLHDAKVDPNSLRRHAGLLEELIVSSPQAGKQLAKEVRKLKGPGSTQVNMWVAGQMHGAMRASFYDIGNQIDRHTNADGPEGQAGFLAPSIAELISRPDVARRLSQESIAGSQGRPIPGTNFKLDDVLNDVLHPKFSDANRREVERELSGGAAQLLRNSLGDATPSKDQMAEVRTAAHFLGHAACAEKRNMKLTSKQAMYRFMSDIVPMMAKLVPATGVPGVGALVDLAAKETSAQLLAQGTAVPNLNGASTKAMLGTAYRQVMSVRDLDQPGGEEDFAKFSNWQSTALNELGTCQHV